MESSAKITSKGQVTIPKAVRDALGVADGDVVIFRVEGGRATLAASVDLLDLAGTVSVPAGKRRAAWDEVRRQTRRARATRA
jgi:antitoxin PrlF